MSESTIQHPQRSAGRKRGLYVGLAVALLVAVTAAGQSGGGPPAASRLDAPDSALQPLPARVARDTLATDLVSRFALNALLATLIDDATPPRWTDVAIHHFCGPATRVEIDGKPLVAGGRVPATAFTVRWSMDECWPFDFATVTLSGIVDLLVFHEENGLSAVVSADRMTISGVTGAGQLRVPFPASLSLASGVDTQ